jgi:ketosteroid isomerase-like protein
MRFMSGLAALVAACVLAGCISVSVEESVHGARTCPVTTSGSDVEELRRLEHYGASVNVEGWSADDARAFFAPEWVSVQPDGSRIDVAAALARFRGGRMPAWAEHFTVSDLDIRVYCDAAVVVGNAEALPRGAPAAAAPMRYRYMNLWRRGPTGWLYAMQIFYTPPAP